MRPKRFTSFLFIALLLLILIAGCNQRGDAPSSPLIIDEHNDAGPAPTARADAAEFTVALVMKTLTNPFFVEMEKGARQAEAELGIVLLVKTTAQETSVEQQITIIDNLIKEPVDAIVIAPADSTELIPVLKKAQDAGIVIVNVDNRLDPEAAARVGLTDVPFISVDNAHGAYLSASYISDQINSPTQAGILEGIRTAKNAEDRKDGALAAFAENSHIEVVAMETANWKIDEAHKVTVQLFAQHPNIGLLFCANDMMALGALRYLEETGRTDVLVASYDALDEALAALRAGTLQATVDQQAALQAYTGVQFAVRALQGETLPLNTLVDVMLITPENIE